MRTLALLSEPSINIRVTAVAPGTIDTPLWRDRPELLELLDQSKGDEWITADYVADVMIKLVEEEKMTVQVKDKETQIMVEGGLILEVGKDRVRKVEMLNDEGPSGKGHTSSNAEKRLKEILQSLERGT